MEAVSPLLPQDPDEARFKGLPDKDVNPRGVDNYEELHVWFQERKQHRRQYGCTEQHIKQGGFISVARIRLREVRSCSRAAPG